MALDIYDADGYLDRGRVMDELAEQLAVVRRTVGATQPKTVAKRNAANKRLVDLLDECCEGFTANPLDAPSMTTDYINACKRVTR